MNNKQTLGCVRSEDDRQYTYREKCERTHTRLWTKVKGEKVREKWKTSKKEKRKLNYIKSQHICYDPIYYICMYMYLCIKIREKKLYLYLVTYRDTPGILSKKQKQKQQIYMLWFYFGKNNWILVYVHPSKVKAWKESHKAVIIVIWGDWDRRLRKR